MTIEPHPEAVKRRNAYAAFDLNSGDLSKLPRPTRKQAIAVARRVWRRAVGRAWPGTWTAGRGNHRSYPRGDTFLVNPGEGWNNIVHGMSHVAYDYLTRRLPGYRAVCSAKALLDYSAVPAKGHHTIAHAHLERQMTAHALELIGRLGRP